MPIPDDAKGLPMASQLSLAITDPGTIIPRAKIRAGGRESVKSWQTRAVWAVLDEHGVDSHNAYLTEPDREAAEREDVALCVTRPYSSEAEEAR